MCTNAECGLTMAGLMSDPLIQMMNRSDGVTQEEHADLWERTRETLVARGALQPVSREAEATR